jgi:hypothetical protein
VRKEEWVREEREEKLIRCGQVYGILTTFLFTHHGRPIIVTHAKRRQMSIFAIVAA